MSRREDCKPESALLLRARLLRAQGSLPNAIHLLETSVKEARSSEERDQLLAELIECCDAARDDDRILQVVEALTGETPRALASAAAALLRMGRFVEAKACSAAVRANHERGPEAAAIAAVAQMSIDGESADTESAGAFARASAPPAAMAALWRRALLGRLLNEIKAGRRSQLESPLAELLRWSRTVFAAAETTDEVAVRHRALCDAALTSRHSM